MEKLRPTERKCGSSNSIIELNNNIEGDHSEAKDQDGAHLERKHKLLQSYFTYCMMSGTRSMFSRYVHMYSM